MTNREWLINKLATASNEELAHTFIQNDPICQDDYGWVDRYTNPFNRKYELNYTYFVGAYKEEIFETDYDKAVKDFVIWLNEEHKDD